MWIARRIPVFRNFYEISVSSSEEISDVFEWLEVANSVFDDLAEKIASKREMAKTFNYFDRGELDMAIYERQAFLNEKASVLWLTAYPFEGVLRPRLLRLPDFSREALEGMLTDLCLMLGLGRLCFLEEDPKEGFNGKQYIKKEKAVFLEEAEFSPVQSPLGMKAYSKGEFLGAFLPVEDGKKGSRDIAMLSLAKILKTKGIAASNVTANFSRVCLDGEKLDALAESAFLSLAKILKNSARGVG